MAVNIFLSVTLTSLINNICFFAY